MRTSKKFIAGSAAAAVALSMFGSGAAMASVQNPITDDQNEFANIAPGTYSGRAAGLDRFGTAIAASKALYSTSKYVIVANYMAWADVLAAAPLADVKDAPILFTRGTKLHEGTKAEIERLGATNILVIGGEGVVPGNVLAQLRGIKGVNVVTQIGGSDRYETARLLAAEAVDNYDNRAYDLEGKRRNIVLIDQREAAYQSALAAYEQARTNTQNAYQDYLAKSAIAAAEWAKFEEIGRELEGVSGYDQQDLIDAINAAANANDSRDFAVGVYDRVLALVEMYHDSIQESEVKSGTIQDVIDYHKAAGTTVGWDGAATLTVGDTTYTSVEELLTANGLTTDAEAMSEVERLQAIRDARVAEANDAAAKVAEIAEDLRKQAIADGKNSEIADRLADQYLVYVAAQDAADKALEAYNKAVEAGSKAWQDYQAALANRPNSLERVQAVNSLNAAIAAAIAAGTDHPAFLASGSDYADALAAGPAAAKEAGVVLLTRGTTIPAPTAEYLANDALTIAVGGEAAAAAPKSIEQYVGANRYETAVKLAEVYFGGSHNYIGLASGEGYADAVVAGATLANLDSTIVLTRANSLPTVTENFLRYNGEYENLIAFGGTASISDAVRDAAVNAIRG